MVMRDTHGDAHGDDTHGDTHGAYTVLNIPDEIAVAALGCDQHSVLRRSGSMLIYSE